MNKKYQIASFFAALAMFTASSAMAEGDIEKGKKVFKKCKSCHMVGEKAKIKQGPILNNILGATAGAKEDYKKKYSKNMIKAGEEGLVWNEETLTEYLTKPKKMIKKTKMKFAGLKKEKDIVNVIAYLKQFSPDYKPEVKEEDAGEKKAAD